MIRRVVALLGISLFAAACGAGAASGPVPTANGAATTAGVPASTGAPNATTGGTVTALGERRSEGGAIEVVATWSSMDPPSLRLTMDTHSVDLDRSDLATVTTLRLDGGDWTAPTRVDAPKGGHHRSGTVTFGSVPSSAFASARLIEVRIVDVGIAERLLSWERAG